jgi:CubicO group peptidase (beta-lactamase class C family)
MTKRWAVVAVLTLFLSGCATMPQKPENPARGDYRHTRDYVSSLARKEMKKHDVTGLSIALVDDRQIIWAAGFGYADKANEVPATPETVYRTGSISKLFTATAVMQLVEQDKFDLDRPLVTYLPEFSIKSRFGTLVPITPRSIMTHHSGLPSDLLKGMWTSNPEPFENEVNLLRDEYAASPPGYVYSYSNVGVTLLGHALEKVAGSDFAAHLEGALLHPLGMTHSSFSQAPDRSVRGSKAYLKGEEVEELPLRGLPAGGLNSTVLDLSRFVQMVLAGGVSGERQILKPETLAETLRPQNTEVPLDLGFRVGLAWMLTGLGGIDLRNVGPVAHQGGATLYHRSMLIVLPEQKLGVVVLANSATAAPVVNTVAIETLKLALEAKTGIAQPQPTDAGVDDGSLPWTELQAYEGHYATMAGVVGVSNEGDHLRAEVMNTPLSLVPRSDGLLGLRYRLLGLIPISLGNLEQVGISRDTVSRREIVKATMNGQELLVGERIKPSPIPESWQKRVGEYEIVNAGNDAVLVEKVRLRQDKGLLLVEYAMPLFVDGRMSLAITPLSGSEAVICGLGRGAGETVRAVTVGGEEMLQYSGYMLRKVPDKKAL